MALLSGEDLVSLQGRTERLRLWVAAQTESALDIEVGRATSGAPFLRIDGIARHVSLARRSGHMLAAMADARVGIDLEVVSSPREPPWNVLASSEQAALRAIHDVGACHVAFLRGWVVKEALVKARGTGFVRDPSALAVTWASDGVPVIHEGDKRVETRFIEVGQLHHGSERFVWACVVL